MVITPNKPDRATNEIIPQDVPGWLLNGSGNYEITVKYDDAFNLPYPNEVFGLEGWTAKHLTLEDTPIDIGNTPVRKWNFTDIEGDTVIIKVEWSENHYTMNYYPNNGTGIIIIKDIPYEDTMTILDGPNKVGSNFREWNTNNIGTGTSYRAKEEVKKLVSEDGGHINLYAMYYARTIVALNVKSDTYTETNVHAHIINRDWYDKQEDIQINTTNEVISEYRITRDKIVKVK